MKGWFLLKRVFTEFYLDHVKRNSAFEHAQNAQI